MALPSLRLCLPLFALGAALLAGCSSDSSDAPPAPQGDAASDGPEEAGEDSAPGVDAGSDGAAEAGQEAGGETGADAAQDQGVEASQDAPGPEASADAQDAGPPTLGKVSVADLSDELKNKDFLLINVHIPYEGEIPGTDANISYLDVPAIEAFIGTQLDKGVVIYCMTNYMSGIAGNALVADGYSQVRYLDGGMSAWKQAGNAVDYHDQ